MGYERQGEGSMSTFERFASRTVIHATLEMQTALSVGGRVSLEPTGTDLPVVRNVDGLPFIPGSSLKGVVRAQMERVLRSVNQKPDFRACELFSDPCVKKKEDVDVIMQNIEQLIKAKQLSEDQQEREFSRRVWEKTCGVCRLFGSPWIASRLAFKDAFLRNAEDLPVTTQIRDGVGIDRDLGAARTGIKYDFEVVVPGAQFGIEIVAENVESWELGLLLAILRPWGEGYMAIGGKSTRGPGWGKLQNVSVHRAEQQDLLNYLLKNQMNAVSVETLQQAFQQKVDATRG
jgi:CRISPR-associated RAMP protein (TIGR02581 family)